MAKKVAQKSGRAIFFNSKSDPPFARARHEILVGVRRVFCLPKKKNVVIFFSRNVIGDLGVPKSGVGTIWENSGFFFMQERDGRFGVFFGGPPKRWAFVTIKGVHHGRGRGNKWHLRCNNWSIPVTAKIGFWIRVGWEPSFF